MKTYYQIFNISHNKSQKLNVFHLILQVVFAQTIDARC